MPKLEKPEKDPETKLIEYKAVKKQFKREVKRMQKDIELLQSSIYQIKMPEYMGPWLEWVKTNAPAKFPIKTFTQWAYSGIGSRGHIKLIKRSYPGPDGGLAVDYTTRLLLSKLHYHIPSKEFRNPKSVKIKPSSVFPKLCKSDEQFFELFKAVIAEKRKRIKNGNDYWDVTKYQDWPEEKSLQKYFVVRGFVELAQHPEIHICRRRPVINENWVFIYFDEDHTQSGDES